VTVSQEAVIGPLNCANSAVVQSTGKLVITILRLAGATSIAAFRHHARQPSRPLRTITKC
jgi:hypothetical protein